MTFEEYCQLIAESVAESGYDSFSPALCVPGEEIRMCLLEGPLSEEGEEALAGEWVLEFTEPGKTVFLAFRSGRRVVTVLEIVGKVATRKRSINVLPYDGPDA